MKTTKKIIATIVACAVVALIYMAGIFPAAEQSDGPEVVPGVSPTSMTMDIIFR
jgi:hypothetical protein